MSQPEPTADRPRPEQRWARSPDVVGWRIVEEFVLVPIRRHASELDSIFTLDTVASRIWDLLDGQRDLSAVAAVITEEFEVELDQALGDAQDLVAELAAVGAAQVA